MELRNLRYFLAVAEELHFARAAERLHIEQSPLSRAIKDLECDLGVQLFERTTRSTHLTWTGQVFLTETRRMLATLEQAISTTKAAATGYRGTLRIALSDGIAQPWFAALLALCREEEPDVEIRLFEVVLAEQIKGLRGNLYDAGFALAFDLFDSLHCSEYSRLLAFESGAGGLVSTADDYHAFLRMLLNKGMCGAERILSSASVARMTQDQLTPRAENWRGLVLWQSQ
jgi:DNA-binding transcriptional LysR family regulator